MFFYVMASQVWLQESEERLRETRVFYSNPRDRRHSILCRVTWGSTSADWSEDIGAGEGGA